MTSSNKILVDKQGALGFLTFNNPERHNAMSLDMWRQAAAELMTIFGADPEHSCRFSAAPEEKLCFRSGYFEIRERTRNGKSGE